MEKIICIRQLLEMQEKLDHIVNLPRENGFIPREIDLDDIKFMIDDEVQEWLRELPKEFNFKNWKEKEYNRENELKELVDILFFILKAINFSGREKLLKFDKNVTIEMINEKIDSIKIEKDKTVLFEIVQYFKVLIYKIKNSKDLAMLTGNYFVLVKMRGFTAEDVFEGYKKKYNENLTRINKDWSKK